MTKLVRMKDETHEGLVSLTQYGSNLGETVQMLLDFYNKTAPIAPEVSATKTGGKRK